MVLEPDMVDAMEAARAEMFEAYRDDPNFTGCAIGLRQREGSFVDEPVIVAMMAKKLPTGMVSRRVMLPEEINVDGRRWGVDVVQVGRLYSQSGRGLVSATPGGGVTLPINERVRPVVQGLSLSNGTEAPGTLGCLVRDNGDGKICVLSSNHVIGRLDLANPGDPITQPASLYGGASADVIATFKRSLSLEASSVFADAAIAQLTDQSGYGTGTAFDLMAGISATHPAVGLVTAADSANRNCFLSRMDRLLPALNVSLLPATSSNSCVVAPTVHTHIEKVGQASGYTSSVISAVSAQIKLSYSTQYGDAQDLSIVMSDMIWTQAFNTTGDSGAVACVGGDGRTFVAPPPQGGCAFLASVGNYYNLPTSNDNTLTSQARDEFLAQSPVGYLLIGIIYANSDQVNARLAGKTANANEQAYAQQYYAQYRNFIANILANPGSTTTVTQDNLNDADTILAGLEGIAGTSILTDQEKTAANSLYNNVLTQTLGMDFQQIINFMNDPAVYDQVYSALAQVGTLNMTGPINGS